MGRQEELLQERIANYLVQNYPNVLFHSDYGSGAKLAKSQAAKQKKLNGGRRAWPDMNIAQPYAINPVNSTPPSRTVNGREYWGNQHGLYLELKKDGDNIYAQRKLSDPNKLSLDGKVYADKHIREQADVLHKLRQAGYCAEFAIGYDHAISIITGYLGEPEQQEIEF